jgi:hypothetical protein
MNSFALLAALTVFVHVTFIAFAIAGGLLAVRWPRVAWAHLPAAGWAVFVEISGGICPLTPLEQAWRQRAGLPGYSGDFVANYVFPVLYPEGLTRGAQVAVAALVVIVNAVAYTWAYYRRRTRSIMEGS